MYLCSIQTLKEILVPSAAKSMTVSTSMSQMFPILLKVGVLLWTLMYCYSNVLAIIWRSHDVLRQIPKPEERI
jgi:hypothetical protein